MKRAMMRLLAALCAAAMLLTGAAALGEGDFVPAMDPQTECELTIAGHYSNFEALEAEFNLFAQYYPNAALSYLKLDNYSSVIDLALSDAEAPDIFFMYPSMIGNEYYDDVFAAAENLADPALNIDLSGVQRSVLYTDESGKVPYLPIFSETYGMLVNEKIFADNGIKIPETYAELVAACEALQAAGYESPVMGYSGDMLLYPMYFPYFCAGIEGDEGALASLNAMDENAGEYAREALELAAGFMDLGYYDIALCDEQLTSDYEPVILRFFEGDVPMMMAKSGTVSGTAKREAKSEAFSANPFPYGFYPVPSTDEGGYLLNVVSMGFAVNGSGDNVDMANEFMRFMAGGDELNRIANGNRMLSTAADMTADSVYAPFESLYPDRVIYQTTLGLDEAPDSQVRRAGIAVCRGEMTVDEAVAAFGSPEQGQ